MSYFKTLLYKFKVTPRISGSFALNSILPECKWKSNDIDIYIQCEGVELNTYHKLILFLKEANFQQGSNTNIFFTFIDSHPVNIILHTDNIEDHLCMFDLEICRVYITPDIKAFTTPSSWRYIERRKLPLLSFGICSDYKFTTNVARAIKYNKRGFKVNNLGEYLLNSQILGERKKIVDVYTLYIYDHIFIHENKLPKFANEIPEQLSLWFSSSLYQIYTPNTDKRRGLWIIKARDEYYYIVYNESFLAEAEEYVNSMESMRVLNAWREKYD